MNLHNSEKSNEPGVRLPQILPGEGANDYTRYMRTDALLSLQTAPAEMVSRDELLFQTVHQTTELWLKHASFEVETAAECLTDDAPEVAIRLLGRARVAIEMTTESLRMLTELAPAEFRDIVPALGNGSGLQSPGWNGTRNASRELGVAFDEWIARQQLSVPKIYAGDPTAVPFRVAEALIAWDDAINHWRVRHYGIALRIRGAQAFGTGGNPVEMLNKLIHRKFFPELWKVRDIIADEGAIE